MILACNIQAYSLPHQGEKPFIRHQIKEYDHEIHQNFRCSCGTVSVLFCQLRPERQRYRLDPDRAEAKIAAQAAEQGASYKITSAQFNNRVHMTAELSK